MWNPNGLWEETSYLSSYYSYLEKRPKTLAGRLYVWMFISTLIDTTIFWCKINRSVTVAPFDKLVSSVLCCFFNFCDKLWKEEGVFYNVHLGLTTGNRSDHVNTGYRSVHSFEQSVLSTVTKKHWIQTNSNVKGYRSSSSFLMMGRLKICIL